MSTPLCAEREAACRSLWQLAVQLRSSMKNYAFSLKVLAAMHGIRFTAVDPQVAVQLIADAQRDESDIGGGNTG